MAVKVASESAVLREVSRVLLQHLRPAYAVRFWAGWQMGQGDYLQWRDVEFADETVATLYKKVEAYQETESAAIRDEFLGE